MHGKKGQYQLKLIKKYGTQNSLYLLMYTVNCMWNLSGVITRQPLI